MIFISKCTFLQKDYNKIRFESRNSDICHLSSIYGMLMIEIVSKMSSVEIFIKYDITLFGNVLCLNNNENNVVEQRAYIWSSINY